MPASLRVRARGADYARQERDVPNRDEGGNGHMVASSYLPHHTAVAAERRAGGSLANAFSETNSFHALTISLYVCLACETTCRAGARNRAAAAAEARAFAAASAQGVLSEEGAGRQAAVSMDIEARGGGERSRGVDGVEGARRAEASGQDLFQHAADLSDLSQHTSTNAARAGKCCPLIQQKLSVLGRSCSHALNDELASVFNQRSACLLCWLIY